MHKQKEAEIRVKKLEAMVGKENILWSKVEDLIATRQPKKYDETVSLLLDLRA